MGNISELPGGRVTNHITGNNRRVQARKCHCTYPCCTVRRWIRVIHSAFVNLTDNAAGFYLSDASAVKRHQVDG